MPTLSYLTNDQIAGLLIKASTEIKTLPADLLSFLTKKSEKISNAKKSYIFNSKTATTLYQEIEYAQQAAQNSVRAKQFLIRITQILRYANGEQKYSSVLDSLKNKNIYIGLKKMHLYKSSPLDGMKWIMSDECTKSKDFFDIFRETVSKITPQQLFQNFADENGEYTTVINKLSKFLKTDAEKYWMQNGLTKSDIEGERRRLNTLVNMLQKPEEHDQKLIQEFKKAQQKPKEKHIQTKEEILEESIKKLQEKIQKLEDENQTLKWQKKNLKEHIERVSNNAMKIKMFGPQIKRTKHAAEIALDVSKTWAK